MDRKRASLSIANSASNAATSGAVSKSQCVSTNKDASSFAYVQERERFLKDLHRFHDGRGTSIVRLPCVGGKPLDLFTLYNVVTQLGGWEKVCNEDLWPKVQEHLKIPNFCSNADYGLRRLYIRFLHHYEKINHFGQDPDGRDDNVETEDAFGRRKGSSILGVSFTYNYHQHNLTVLREDSMQFEMTRLAIINNAVDAIHSAFGEILQFSDGSYDTFGGFARDMNHYTHLERSLLSGLPNEIDFAMNVSLLFSYEGRPEMSGTKGRRIVDCMLSCVGLYKDGIMAPKVLLEDVAARKFVQFWNETVDDRSVKGLLCPETLLFQKGLEASSLDDDPQNVVDRYWDSNLKRSPIEDFQGQRVTQLAMILRNLSFEEENLEMMSSNPLLIRFLMLCIYNNYGKVRQLALDTLSNLAYKMELESVDTNLMQLVLKTVKQSISSADKLEVITALETLSRLCQVEINEEVLFSHLDDTIYDQIVELLTIRDIPLLVSVLEALYQLSELGPVTTMRIAQSSAAVGILIGLLTLEIQSYGPESLAGSKVVEYLHVSALQPQEQIGPNTMPNVPCQQVAAMGAMVQPAPGQLMGPPTRPPPSSVGVRQPQTAPENPTTSQNGVFALPRVPSMSSPHPLPRQSGPPMLQGVPGAVMDREAVACNWLQTQYEYRSDFNTGMMGTELYRRYAASCSAACGAQSLLNPVMFGSCVRVVFPVSEMELFSKDTTPEVLYKGIVPRRSQSVMTCATGAQSVMQPGAIERGPMMIAGPPGGQMMTAGPPVMLRQPVQYVRQQLLVPSLDQSGLKTSNFSSIHQALIGNIRPQTDTFPHPLSGPSTSAVTPSMVNNQQAMVMSSVMVNRSVPAVIGGSVVTPAVPGSNNGVCAKSDTEAKSVHDSSAFHDTQKTFDLSLQDNSAVTREQSSVNSKDDHLSNSSVQPTASSDGSVKETATISNGLLKNETIDALSPLKQTLNDMNNGDAKEVRVNGTAHSAANPRLNNGDSKLLTSVPSVIDAFPASEVVNGHKSGLVNGNVSPVPSCDSDEIDTCDIKRKDGGKNPMTNGLLEHDDDSSSTGPMEIDDVLCKAMIRADIIDEVGRPAAVHMEEPEDECDTPTDFLAGFITAGLDDALGNSVDTGFDEEAATAVAGLLKDEDCAVDSTEVSNDQSELNLPSDKVPVISSESVLPMSTSASSTPNMMNAVPVNVNQMQQTGFVVQRPALPPPCATQNQSASCVVQPDKAITPGQLLQNGVPSAGDAIVPYLQETSAGAVQPGAPLPNGLMFSPQCSIALPTGQMVQGGVRLLLRQSGPGLAPYVSGGVPSASLVSWNRPGLAPACQTSYGNGVGPGLPVSVSVSSTLNNGGMAQLTSSASIISTHNQLLLQHAQLLSSSATSPMFQRVLLPHPITMSRPDGQVLMQQQLGQQQQVAGVRPLLTNQAALGQLHMTGVAHGQVQVCASEQVPGAHPVIVNQQVLGLPGHHQPTSQNAIAPVACENQQSVATSNDASAHPPYIVRPLQQPGQPLQNIFNPQHPVRLLAGSGMQLHSGLVQGCSPGGNPVFLQHGGRPILIQQPLPGPNQPRPGYMMFRPGAPQLIAPRPVLASEPGTEGSDTGSNQAVSTSSVATLCINQSDSSTPSKKRPPPAIGASRSLRKRKRADEDGGDRNENSVTTRQNGSTPFLCEWNSCQKSFETFKQIYKHVTTEHFDCNATLPTVCQWTGCDNLPRQRWSFMTHLQDRHLNENILRQANEQRSLQEAQTPSRPPTALPPPVYPPNAALQAIRRFSARQPFPELMDATEGPVTKHVRLTAALILRNLARYSSLGRSILRRHEQLLSYTAFSNVEASLALSHCLHELQKH